MSIRVIYKLTTTKKKSTCQAILEHELSNEIFKFVTPYIDNSDLTCLKQVKQVIKLTKNCAEFIQLHSLLLSKDCVSYLIRVVEKTIQEDKVNEAKEDFGESIQKELENEEEE